MTIEQFLRGLVDFNVSDSTLASILYLRQVVMGTDVECVSEKQRDLCLADLYVYMSNSSTITSGEYESDGGWQHRSAAQNVTNRSELRKMAKDIYRKWGDPKADSHVGNVVMKPLYK